MTLGLRAAGREGGGGEWLPGKTSIVAQCIRTKNLLERQIHEVVKTVNPNLPKIKKFTSGNNEYRKLKRGVTFDPAYRSGIHGKMRSDVGGTLNGKHERS